jgi:hypothetical protein
VAARLSELIDDVYGITVDRDEKRELLTLQLTTLNRIEHPAKALSDGTLRFLALAVMELDPNTQGVLCLEEPENGIHPERIPAILRLLSDISVDVYEPVDSDNPLRQVLINTHSPVVVQQVSDADLLAAETYGKGVQFACLPETWRARSEKPLIVSRGRIGVYLNPSGVQVANVAYVGDSNRERKPYRRVMDRDDLQLFLPFVGGSGQK